MKVAIRILCFFLFLFSLSGCLLPGNGEGYGNKPTANGTGDGPLGHAALTYYLIDPTYTCTDVATGSVIPSYRSSIAIINSGAILSGDRCNPTKIALSTSEVEQSYSRQYLGYKDEVYLNILGKITDEVLAASRPVEALCINIQPKANEIYDLAIRSPLKSGDPILADILFANSPPLLIPVSKIEQATSRSYTADQFDITILFDATDFQHPGKLKSSLTTQTLTQDMRCRIKVPVQ